MKFGKCDCPVSIKWILCLMHPSLKEEWHGNNSSPRTFTVCVWVYVCVSLCIHTEERGGGQASYSTTVRFIPLKQDLSLNLKLGWQSANPEIITASAPQHWDYKGCVRTPGIFLCDAGDWNSSPCDFWENISSCCVVSLALKIILYSAQYQRDKTLNVKTTTDLI